MNNFEKIKAMSLDEMAEWLALSECQECGYIEDYKNCIQTNCYNHKSNGYEQHKQWLKQEAE